MDYNYGDTVLYRENPDTGEKVRDSVLRPRAFRNDLGPIPQGVPVTITIKKNTTDLIQFAYTMEYAPDAGRVVMGVAAFEWVEISDQLPIAPQEVITCRDNRIYRKDENDQWVLVSIDRPRNIQRQNIGPFAVGDLAHVVFAVGGMPLANILYTITEPPTTGNMIVGRGLVDFVELNWPS